MKTIVIINSQFMGQDDPELGQKIMQTFLGKAAVLQDLEAIAFYNSGVKLLADGSAVMQQLMALEEQGVDLIACGTCVTHFKLDDVIGVGQIGNMEGIVSLMKRADKVITL